ncbi:MAG: hypothetical protein AAFX06_24170 [Planctomycetota bacterium]
MIRDGVLPGSIAAEICKTFDMDGFIVFLFARSLDSIVFAVDGRSGEDVVAMQSAAEAFMQTMGQAMETPDGDAVAEMCEHNMVLMSAAKRAVELLENGGALAIAEAMAVLREAITATNSET